MAADGGAGAARAQLPLPWNTFLTEDFINEMTGDHVLPKGVLTLQDLGISARSARPAPRPCPVRPQRCPKRRTSAVGTRPTRASCQVPEPVSITAADQARALTTEGSPRLVWPVRLYQRLAPQLRCSLRLASSAQLHTVNVEHCASW